MVSIWAALVLIALALPASDQQALEKQFQEKQRATSTFQAGFKQTLRLEDVREPVVSEGKFFYAAPGSLLIRFERPRGEYVLLNDGEVVIKKIGKAAVRRKIPADSWQHGAGMLLELFRNGGERFHEKYAIQMQKSGSDLLVTLTRKEDDDELPAKIENRLSASDLLIKSVHIEFGGAQSLDYEFLKPQRDATIPADTFKPPESR